MKTARLTLILLLPLLAGCIQIDETLSLESDGSGTIDLKYVIPEQTVNQIGGMLTLAGQLAEAADKPSPYDEHDYLVLLLSPSEERIMELAGRYEAAGIMLQEVAVKSRDAAREVTISLAFRNLAALYEADFFKEQGFRLDKLPSGNYRLGRFTEGSTEAANVDMNDPATVRMLTPLLGGFDATITMKVPGRILKTNTTRRDSRQAVWQFDFNRDPKAFRAFYNQDIAVIFEGTGLNLPVTPSQK